ncbi:S41 family peptidase [Erysipelothrix sp. D19-032]
MIRSICLSSVSGLHIWKSADTNMVTNVIKGSPVKPGGILAGDVISKVDGVSTFSSDIPIKEMIQGEAGQPIKMEVLRAGKPVTLEIVRGRVEALAFGEVIEPGVGYLEMKSFGRGLADVTESILKDFKAKGVKNLVIDLRDNGGGYLDAIQDVARLFPDEGAIVYQEHFTNGKTETYTVKNSVASNYKFDDITILINEGTASASEVLTLALTENLGAKTVGMKSYGKGTVQTQRIYGDSSNLKITIAEWRAQVILVSIMLVFYRIMKLSYRMYSTHHIRSLEHQNMPMIRSVSQRSYAQHALTYLGYHNGRTDGYYDSATRDAILAYANAETINTDGTINQALLQRMYSSVLYTWNGNRAVDDVQLIKALEVAKHGS